MAKNDDKNLDTSSEELSDEEALKLLGEISSSENSNVTESSPTETAAETKSTSAEISDEDAQKLLAAMEGAPSEPKPSAPIATATNEVMSDDEALKLLAAMDGSPSQPNTATPAAPAAAAGAGRGRHRRTVRCACSRPPLPGRPSRRSPQEVRPNCRPSGAIRGTHDGLPEAARRTYPPPRRRERKAT